LQHQDPTKPYDNEQMAAQMANFSSLEQMFNMNKNLEKLSDSQKPLHQLSAASLIGKWVTSDSSRFAHTEGKYSDLKFDIPVDAGKVTVAILNEKGETIREIQKTDLKKGAQSIQWDGRRSNNLQAPSGNYVIQVKAESSQGKAIAVKTSNKSQVNGISFDGNDTVLLVGDLKNPTKLLLRTVARIENDDGSAANKSAAPVPAVAPVTTAPNAPGVSAEVVPAQDLVVPNSEPGQSAKFQMIDPAMLTGLFTPPEVPPKAEGGPST